MSMKRRDFLRNAGLLAGAAVCAERTTAAVDAPPTPNIILIMADDLGWEELGCYGQKKILTPNVDRLAAEGMRFTDYYSGSAVCAPARCNLMTGMHGGHAIVRNNYEAKPSTFGDAFGGQYPLPQGTVTIASMLKKAGYATGCFGKWGLGGVGTSGDPLKQGFDRFFGFNCQRHAHNLYPRYLVDDDKQRPLEGNTRGQTGKQYGPQAVADELLAFIRANAARPFFAYYPTVIPHLALQAPDEDIAQYRGKWEEKPYTGRSYLPHPTPKSCYAAMISFLDKQVGRVMSLLKELGIDDNTVVLFTSDNGTTFLKAQVDYAFFASVGPLRGLKGSLYEGGIRVPMVVRWPGRIKRGSVTALPAAHYDALATIADFAGLRAPTTDGISLRPTLTGNADEQKKHDYLFWDFAGYGAQLAVRMGKWKGLKRGLKKRPDAPLELYNLEADIGETENVAAANPAVVARIETIMREARTEPDCERFRFGRYR